MSFVATSCCKWSVLGRGCRHTEFVAVDETYWEAPDAGDEPNVTGPNVIGLAELLPVGEPSLSIYLEHIAAWIDGPHASEEQFDEVVDALKANPRSLEQFDIFEQMTYAGYRQAVGEIARSQAESLETWAPRLSRPSKRHQYRAVASRFRALSRSVTGALARSTGLYVPAAPRTPGRPRRARATARTASRASPSGEPDLPPPPLGGFRRLLVRLFREAR